MVHKKSEYRLNYKWIPSDFCKQSWESGHSYRLQRRQYDLSHMPLPWESQGCECDVDDHDNDEILPVPKTRLKHNILNEVWDQDAQRFGDPSMQGVGAEKWYRRWEEHEHHAKPHPSPVKATTASPERSPTQKVPTAEVRNPESTDLKNCRQKGATNHERSEKPGKMNGALNGTKFDRNGFYKEQIDLARQRSLSQMNLDKATQTFGRLRSLSPRRHKLDVTATEPTMPQLTKPKILSYGWASQRDVGDKRTFNIYAPTRDKSQFHPSALRAWKRKDHDVYQTSDHEMQSRLTEKVTPRIVDRGYTWTTEYQQQYNDQKYTRPISAPPGRWRNIGHVYHRCNV